MGKIKELVIEREELWEGMCEAMIEYSEEVTDLPDAIAHITESLPKYREITNKIFDRGHADVDIAIIKETEEYLVTKKFVQYMLDDYMELCETSFQTTDDSSEPIPFSVEQLAVVRQKLTGLFDLE